jgi:hypothetical protein
MAEENQPQQDSNQNSPKFTPQRLTDRILPSFPKLQTWWDGVLQSIRALVPETLGSKLNDFVLTGIISGLVVAILLTTVALIPDRQTELAQLPPTELEVEVEVIAPELTPEQNLMVAIQQKVETILSPYPGNLVESVVANSPLNLLTIQLQPAWYQLDVSGQDELVENVFRRSQQLNFHKLEIKDTQGRLLARNSFIGKGMLITLREI